MKGMQWIYYTWTSVRLLIKSNLTFSQVMDQYKMAGGFKWGSCYLKRGEQLQGEPQMEEGCLLEASKEQASGACKL